MHDPDLLIRAVAVGERCLEAWDERAHPRDRHGRFTSKAGAGAAERWLRDRANADGSRVQRVSDATDPASLATMRAAQRALGGPGPVGSRGGPLPARRSGPAGASLLTPASAQAFRLSHGPIGGRGASAATRSGPGGASSMARRARQLGITMRQEGGDDGYSYVVRHGSKSISGLTRREAKYYRDQFVRDAENRTVSARTTVSRGAY